MLIGLGITIFGIVYYSSIATASTMMAVVISLSGLGMMGVGGAALFAVQKEEVFMLAVVWTLDCVLFCLFVVFTIVGFMVGMDVRDPTRTSTDNVWGIYSEPELTAQVEWRRTFWDGAYCTTNKVFGGRKQACDAVFVYQATLALSPGTDSNYTEGTTVRDLFADCEFAKQGVACEVSELAADTAACAAVDLVTGGATVAKGACEAATTPGTAIGCAYEAAVAAVAADAAATPPVVGVDGVAVSCLPAPDCGVGESLKTSCEHCNQLCKEDLIADVKANLLPASYVVFAVLIFCIVAALVNDSMITDADFGGLFGLLSVFISK